METFDDEFGDLSGYKILSFEEVAKGFTGNKNPLQGFSQVLKSDNEYKNDGYINLNLLLDDIRQAHKAGNKMEYIYQKYFQDVFQNYIMYENTHIDVSAKIYLKDGNINVSERLGRDKPYMEMFFDEEARLTYSLTFRYINTLQDAIELRTQSFSNYKNLLLYLGYGDIETDYQASSYFINKFTDFLKNEKNTVDNLYNLYTDLPKSFIVHIQLSTDIVIKQLKILSKEDDTGWFSWTSDASSLLIRVMAMFRKYEEIINYFNKNPKFLNEIYNNLDGYSDGWGSPISNRILFSLILNLFIQREKNVKAKVTNSFIGINGYFIESNILELNDTLNNIKSIVSFDWDFDYHDAIFLQQKRNVLRIKERPLITEDGKPLGDITVEESVTVTENIDPGYFYNPISPVYYLDKDGNTNIVTALFVKAIADEKEWEEVTHFIRIGGDIIAIIAGLITLGTTSEFSALAIADLTLASIDLTMMNKEVKEWLSDQGTAGKWFVENWDVIYALVGAGIMSIVIMDGILTFGTVLLRNLKQLRNLKENLRNFTLQLENLITGLNTYKAKTTTNIIEEVIIAAKSNDLLEKLLKPFLTPEANLEYILEQLAKRKISVKKAGDNLYEIYYNGKLVMATDANEAGAFLKDNFWKTERQLEEAAKMAKPHDIDKYLGGKILKESQIRKFRGDLKKRGTTLILEEDIQLNKFGKVADKDVIKNFKPIILDRFRFDDIYDLYNYLRRRGYAGLFDHHNKQIILTANPTEYLIFHEMSHLKHLEEIKEVYNTLLPWQRETYVFEEIWKQRHLWTREELEHALRYVNKERKEAGQSLIIKKL